MGDKCPRKRYINRLWQYIKERLSDTQSAVIFGNLQDVGTRIDSLYAAANSGLHGTPTAIGVHRMLVNLTMLVFDLLTLSDIDVSAGPAYKREQDKILRRMVLGVDDDD